MASRERYSTPLTCATTEGRLEVKVAATSLGTTSAWPPPWPTARTSAENAMGRALGATARVDQLPGARQQPSSQQNLDHIANQERHNALGKCGAERQIRQQHQAGHAEDVNDDVSERHHADCCHYASVSTTLCKPTDQPRRCNETHDVAEGCEGPAALLVCEPWHASDSSQQIQGHGRGAPDAAESRTH